MQRARSLAVAAFALSALGSCGSPPPVVSPPPPALEEPPPDVIKQRTPLVMATSEPEDPEPAVAAPSPEDPCAVRLDRGRSSCHVLIPLSASATLSSGDAMRAGDGSTCTEWNAGGFAPASVTLDLGTPTRIDAIVLVPEMSPGGRVRHEIAFSDDGRSFQVGHRVEAPMQTRVPVELPLPRPERARFVRVTTTSSPSFVAWREVALFRCGSEAGARSP
jgi:hypothetical protein